MNKFVLSSNTSTEDFIKPLISIIHSFRKNFIGHENILEFFILTISKTFSPSSFLLEKSYSQSLPAKPQIMQKNLSLVVKPHSTTKKLMSMSHDFWGWLIGDTVSWLSTQQVTIMSARLANSSRHSIPPFSSIR
jgi:hypothetical protein